MINQKRLNKKERDRETETRKTRRALVEMINQPSLNNQNPKKKKKGMRCERKAREKKIDIHPNSFNDLVAQSIKT